MRVAHERRRTRTPDELRVEELISPEILDNEMVDREYLTRVLRDPRKHLPPPRQRSKDDAEPLREPESRGAKLAKLTGLSVAGALLVGAVVVSSVLHEDGGASAAPPSPAPPRITGVAALGGFAAGDPGSPGHGGGSAGHAQPTTSAHAPETGDTPLMAGQQSAGSTASAPGTTAPGGATAGLTDADRVALVTEFYRRVESDPQQALELLTPALAGDAAGDLVRTWGSMRDVVVLDTRVQPDGSVLAVVLMRRTDGAELRVTQQLGLDETGRSIAEAALLAAEEL